jgi:succinoglycan biosynthesis transport protein ExoP
VTEDQDSIPSNQSGQSGQLVAVATNEVAVRGYGQMCPHGAAGISQAEALRATFLEHVRILLKRKWVVLSLVAASVALGAFRTLMITPQFTSTVRLQIDRNVTKVIEGGDTTPVESIFDLEFMRTQYELLQSRAVAERTVSMLKLSDDASFRKPRDFSIFGSITGLFSWHSASTVPPSQAALERAAAGIILANRTVNPVSGSSLFDVSYADPSPERAQRVVTGLVDAFIASTQDRRFQANAYAKTFLEDQVKQLQLRLQESERAVLEFGQKEQIVATGEKSSIAESNLASANAMLGNIVAERIKNEQLWKQVESADTISLPQFLTNQVMEGLRDRRNALLAEYQEKLERFKPNYPAMMQISNKIKELDHQLGVETSVIKASLKGAYEGSLEQESQMKQQIALLRAEVLDLQKRSIQYNIVKREADTNRTLYDNLLQRYKEVDIAGGIGANNVFIVEKAEVPAVASSPRVTRNLLIALFLGLCAGIAAAFVLERLDDTVNSVEETERVTGLATLGMIPKLDAGRDVETEFANVRSDLSDAYRTLCTSLHFATERGLPKSLLVTSSAPLEGKSTTAIAVARHFASLGMPVLLIDGDLGLHNAKGLTNYLTGSAMLPETFQRTSMPNLTFMSSGPLPPNAADLLSSPRLLALLSVGMKVFRLIVIDGPPVLGLADAQLLSSAAAGTVFIVAAGAARKNMIRGSLRRLQFARGAVIGTLLTRYDAKVATYGYGYGYGYDHRHGDGGYECGHDPAASRTLAAAAGGKELDAGKGAS